MVLADKGFEQQGAETMPAQRVPTVDQMLRVLTAATDKNALHWNKTAEEDTFRAQFGLGMVRISKVFGAPRYILSVLDRDGTLLDEYEPSGEGELIALEVLYKRARGQALDLAGKLKDIYDNLKQLAGES